MKSIRDDSWTFIKEEEKNAIDIKKSWWINALKRPMMYSFGWLLSSYSFLDIYPFKEKKKKSKKEEKYLFRWFFTNF